MPSSPLTKFALLLVMLVGALGCDRQDSANKRNPSLTPVLIQLNWYPETEHGGVYQGKIAGLYEAVGVDVTIRAGGPGTRIGTELASGRVPFAIANADDVALFRQEGVDAVAVLAAMQNHPRCILVRADAEVASFEDLSGMILQCQPGQCFLTFMEKRGFLQGVQQVPYAGSIAGLVSDKKTAVQAYSFSEPLLAQQQGVEVKTLMLSDLGWNPYSSVLVTTGKMIREQPQLVRNVVLATQRGWHQFLHDPQRANAALLEANSEGMTAEVLEFGYRGLKELAMPDGMALRQVGAMRQERWQQMVDQMIEMGLVDASKVKAEECYTTEFMMPESLE